MGKIKDANHQMAGGGGGPVTGSVGQQI